MSYLVLARKYRPKTFTEVVGQEAAATALLNAITNNRVGHAFLFSGPRGVGKTSMARILAKALNCEQNQSGNPCGQCEMCKAIDTGQDVDIQEIDAATYSKVENIRELRETIPYSTFRAKYKILIVDEVHRLSDAAFDALLKILEEPPSHVKFIFATTELHKVPDTIVSRCQPYSFPRIGETEIVARLKEICAQEELQVPDNVLLEIARISRGGLRDSLSMLDQLIALAGKQPTLQDLEKISGQASANSLFFLFEKIFARDAKAVLEFFAQQSAHNGGEEVFLNQLLEFLRRLIFMKVCGAQSSMINETAQEAQRLANLVGAVSLESLERLVTIALSAKEKLRFLAGHGNALIELALLRMSRIGNVLPYEEILQRLEGVAPQEIDQPVAADYELPAQPPRQTESPTQGQELWRQVLKALQKERKSFANLLTQKASFLGMEGNVFRVKVANLQQIEHSLCQDPKNRQVAEGILHQVIGTPVSFEMIYEDARKAAQKSTPGNSMVEQTMNLFEGKLVE